MQEVPDKNEGDMLFSKYIEKVRLPALKHDVEIITYAGYKQEVLKIVEYFEKTKLTVRSSKAKDIEKLYAFLLDDENGRGLTRCTAQKYHEEKIKNDPVLAVYRTAYKKYHARVIKKKCNRVTF